MNVRAGDILNIVDERDNSIQLMGTIVETNEFEAHTNTGFVLMVVRDRGAAHDVVSGEV